MERQLFDFMLEIPQALAQFGEWLIKPLSPEYFGELSPLGILGIGGASVIITIIAVHIVRLFI